MRNAPQRDEFCKRSAVVAGYKVFRKKKQERKNESCPICKKTQQPNTSCIEISLKNINAHIKSIWVKMRDRVNKGNFMIDCYYMLLDQGDDVNEELDVCWNCKYVTEQLFVFYEP